MLSPLDQPAKEEQRVKRNDPNFDAKGYLERTLSRQSGDRLKVFPMKRGDSFRVNWYSSKASQQGTIPGMSTAYIRESKFLYCRLNAMGAPEITYPAKQ